MAPLLALLAGGGTYCFSQIRLLHFTKKERARIEMLIQRDSLLLMPEVALRELLIKAALQEQQGQAGEIYLLQQERLVTVDDLLPILRHCGADAKLFVTTTLDGDALRFLARNAGGLALCDGAEILEHLQLPPMTSEQEEQYITALLSKRRMHNYLKKISIINSGWKKYALIGFVILLLSFFFRPVIYYRLLSSLCFLLSGTGIFINYKNTIK